MSIPESLSDKNVQCETEFRGSSLTLKSSKV